MLMQTSNVVYIIVSIKMPITGKLSMVGMFTRLTATSFVSIAKQVVPNPIDEYTTFLRTTWVFDGQKSQSVLIA
jgi:hypothetical protein